MHDITPDGRLILDILGQMIYEIMLTLSIVVLLGVVGYSFAFGCGYLGPQEPTNSWAISSHCERSQGRRKCPILDVLRTLSLTTE